MSTFTSTLDLSKLLLLHSTLSAVTAVGISPSYNLPIALYGLYVTSPTSGADADALRTFTSMIGLSAVLDIFWLISWSGLPAGLAVFLILVNLALKPVTLLACTANLRQRGEPTLPNFNAQHTLWSAPGATNGYTGMDGDAEEYGDDPAPPKARTAPQSQQQSHAPPSAPAAPPRGPAQGGGYHTLGEDE